MIVERHVCTFHALGGTNEVQLFAPSEGVARAVFAAVVAEVQRIEQAYSRFRPESVVSRIGKAAGGEPLTVDSETAQLLGVADALFRLSGGLFDITSGALQRAWDFRSPELPSPSVLEAALRLVGWRRVEWCAPRIRLPEAGMSLDFGGFGKEYAVDRAAAVCRAMDIDSGLVNFGGDLVVLGPKPDGSPWQVGIRHPRERGAVLKQCALTTGALATSGDYERFKIVDGRRYCHLINPKTGIPVSELQCVSVFSSSCLLAGAASTIAMLCGKTAGYAFLSSIGASALMVDDEGQLTPVERSPVSFPRDVRQEDALRVLRDVGGAPVG